MFIRSSSAGRYQAVYQASGATGWVIQAVTGGGTTTVAGPANDPQGDDFLLTGGSSVLLQVRNGESGAITLTLLTGSYGSTPSTQVLTANVSTPLSEAGSDSCGLISFGGGCTWSNYTLANLGGSPSVTISPTSATTGATGVAFTLTGANTSWVSGTAATLSGGTGASITSQATDYTASPQTITGTFNAGSAAGTLTFGDTTDSATATLTLGSPPGVPSLTATPGNAHITLSWGSVSGATTYTLFRGTSSGGESSYQTGLTGTSYNDTGLTNGTAYYYKLKAVNTYGSSTASSEQSATPSGPAAIASGQPFDVATFPSNYAGGTPTLTLLHLSTDGSESTVSGGEVSESVSAPANFNVVAPSGFIGRYTLSVTNNGSTATASGVLTAQTPVTLTSSGLSNISVADPGAIANMTTLDKLIVAIYRRLYKKVAKTPTSITMIADDGETVNATQAITDNGAGTQTQGVAT